MSLKIGKGLDIIGGATGTVWCYMDLVLYDEEGFIKKLSGILKDFLMGFK